MSYPNREPFYAHKLTRLLFKSCAAQSLGQDAVLLVIHIAHTEDAAKYQGPVRFWNSQLNEVLGFRSPKSLNNARHRAIEGGWLKYERSHDRAVGSYWTTIPSRVSRFNDEPIEPCGTVPSTEREAEQETDLRVVLGTGSGTGSGTGNDLLSIPIPIPNKHTDEKSSESVSAKDKNRKTQAAKVAGFDQWYAAYPKKVAKGAAEKAYPKAIAEIQRAERTNADQAEVLLLQWTQERLVSLTALESRYRPNPATWLNAKRYRDEIGATRNDERDEYEDFTSKGQKRA